MGIYRPYGRRANTAFVKRIHASEISEFPDGLSKCVDKGSLSLKAVKEIKFP